MLFRSFDPNAVIHRMEAWMPDTIATYKLRGFVNDVGGEVVESLPGMIRVRLGGRGSAYAAPRGPLSWFGVGRQDSMVEMELRLERSNANQQNVLHITVMMRSLDRTAVISPSLRRRCDQIFCDLRAYLAGASVHQ